MKKAIFSVLMLLSSYGGTKAYAICPLGKDMFGMTAITKTCYSCMFPIRIAGVPVVNGPMPDINGQAAATSAPICICPIPFPPYVRIGITASYFLPDRIAEVVKDPGCFPNLGIQIPANLMIAGDSTEAEGHDKHLKMQSHLIAFNFLELIGLATDVLCLESPSFDVLYITEFDPLWQSDGLSAFLNPEAIMFGNPFANLACIPDSISTSVFTPIDPLFWCLGSHGNAYPLAGSTDNTKDYTEGALTMAEKLVYKLHRELILWDESGKYNYCTKMPAPVWTKSNYRFQIITPIPHFIGQTVGQTGMVWSFGKNPPVPGTNDNFGFVLFKKRGCCVF
jgi:conjugal transfer pilus assembly protein TraU